MVVSDQTDPNMMYLYIPPKPDFDDMELTNEQLEQVAGGELTSILNPTYTTSALQIPRFW